MKEHIRNALQYLLNTGESVNAAQFDDDHDPIGPRLRLDIEPYITIDAAGVLKLTPAARAEMKKPE